MDETESLPREAFEAEWLHLTDGEHVRWAGRPSWKILVPAIAFGLILAIVGVGLTYWLSNSSIGFPSLIAYLPLLISLAGVGYGLLAFGKWFRIRYVITDEEIYVKYGFVSRDVTQIRLDRVQNTAYEQTVLDRVLSIGDVEIYTAGTSTEDIVLEDVPRPANVKRILTRLLSHARSVSQRQDVEP